MATLIKVDGSKEEVVVPEDDSSLSFLQEMVGGMIELVPVLGEEAKQAGYVELICDEEGKLKCKPVNEVATKMAGRDGGYGFSDPLCGDCLFCIEGEIK